MYRLAGFRGWPATILKFTILAIVDIVGGIALSQAIAGQATVMAIAIGLILLAVNGVYLFKAPVQWKFLTPGLVFLCAFVLTPIFYTVGMSGFKFTTGNEITKDEAIVKLVADSLSEDAEGTAYDITLGTDSAGGPAALMLNQLDGVVSLANFDGVTPLEEGTYEVNEWGVPFAADGFTAFTPDELSDLGDKVTQWRFPLGDGSFASPIYPELAVRLTQDLTYDAATDTLLSASTGIVYEDNGDGNFANPDKPKQILYPGWRAVNFPDNFKGLLFDPEIRNPFIGVFGWTIAFAFLSVFTTFVVGLTLAIAMDKQIKGRRVYRSILILPYAIPGFLSILIWRGMFQRDFGIINRLLMDFGLIDANIDWFENTWTARAVILIVNLWLGFPYMYLISSGALQAIPAELKEAAAIDGASPWQTFRTIVLPLLLQILNPLLISSFAFNFNNFNIIYLLTGGGPRDELGGERAGSTDILISYAYQTAITNPLDQNFGLASAISLFMFFIVGALSMWSLRRSKALEEF